MAEGGGLENRFTSDRDGGSNPSPSASPYCILIFSSFIFSLEAFLVLLGKLMRRSSGGERAG